MLNAPWIDKAVGILILVATFALFWPIGWLEKRTYPDAYSADKIASATRAASTEAFTT